MRDDLPLRRAHVALALTFVAFGVVDGTWTARLPALKQRLALDSGELGLIVFAVSGAATLVLPLAGWLRPDSVAGIRQLWGSCSRRDRSRPRRSSPAWAR